MLRLVPAGTLAIALLQSTTVDYRDPSGRFSFAYPSAFGATSPGTDNGFRDRAASIRFSRFPARLGGEAVVTTGFPLLDLQAAGGLYDGMALQILPEMLRVTVVNQLPRLSPANVCGVLNQTRHVNPDAAAFADWLAPQRQAIGD